MLGLVYERIGDLDRAKKEYASYLSLYPDDSAERTKVKLRLIALEIREPKEKLNVAKNIKPNEGSSSEVSGSASEYLFWDSRNVSAITGVSLFGSQTHNQYTLSSRFRLSDMRSLNSSLQRKNVSLANLSFNDSYKHYSVTLGRQFPEAGAISRFDGITAKYSLNDDLRFVVAAGAPWMGNATTSTRRFYGSEIQWNVTNNLISNFYLNRGTADGFVERFAVGNSLEYLNNNTSAVIRSEYDLLYKTVNQASVQLNKTFSDYTVFLLYDRRRSPFLYADRALNVGLYSPYKESYSSISELLTKSGLTDDQIYKYITTSTPYYNSFVAGASAKVSDKWTASVNFQTSNLTTTNEINLNTFDPIPISVGMKNNYSVGAHLRGDDVLLRGNSPELYVNYVTGDYKAYTVTAADSFRFGRNNASVILRYDDMSRGYSQGKFSAIVRFLYSITENGTIDTQYIFTDSPSAYIGYRYDF